MERLSVGIVASMRIVSTIDMESREIPQRLLNATCCPREIILEWLDGCVENLILFRGHALSKIAHRWNLTMASITRSMSPRLSTPPHRNLTIQAQTPNKLKFSSPNLQRHSSNS
jgi:hypothetical protein